MVTEPPALAPLIVEEALRQALAGDPRGGGMLLAPLISESRRECFALCAMLATAALRGTQPNGPNGMYVLEVEDTWTGRPGRIEDLTPDVRFAARFAAALANEDRPAAQALFDALTAGAHTETGVDRLVDGVLALFGMAVATTRALIDEQRNDSNHRED
ncbi:hypothetical protein ACFVH9_08580 [Streptomyces hirsutus]|uniref:hypothetical protein n=1 Tax=Streptomyces hirsutus TaxID=35620 RepID=UPI0036401BE0